MRKIITALAYAIICYTLTSCCSSRPSGSMRPETTEANPKHCDCNAGANVSSISGEEDDSYDASLVGFHAGVSFSLIDFTSASAQRNYEDYLDFPSGFRMAAKTSGGFSIRPGISFSQQGSKYTDNGIKGHVRLNYINVPIMLRYSTPGGFFAEAGLQLGLLLSARDKYDGNNDNYKDYMNSFDFGVPFGIGYEINNRFGLGLRAVPGVANIDKLEDGDTDKNRNFVIGFRLFYLL